MQDPTDRTPRRWTLHGLNSGGIFGMTYYGVRVLPRAVSYAIGHVGAWIAWRLMPQSNAAIAANLEALFPGDSEARRTRRALDVYRSYTRDTIDFLRALDTRGQTDGMFEISDDTRRRATALHASNRGVILVTGHHGNWEAGGLMLTRYLGFPLTVVAMTEPSPTVNRIRREIRTRMGVETVEVRQSLDTPLRIRAALGRKQFVAMLVDRHLGKDRIAVDFLGRRAWFLRTPIVLAALTGAPLAPCFIQRIGPGRFRATLGRHIEIAPDVPRDEGMAAAAQQIADQIADQVRAHPESWYQFYRYWDAQHDEYDGLD